MGERNEGWNHHRMLQVPEMGEVRIHQPIEPHVTGRPWATETQLQQLEKMEVPLKALCWSIIVNCLQAF